MKKILHLATAALVALSIGTPAAAQSGGPAAADQTEFPDASQTASLVSSRALTGEIDLAVGLIGPSLAELAGPNAKHTGGLDAPRQRAHKADLALKQQAVVDRLAGLGGAERARLTKALNAVVIRIDGSRIDDVLALPGVAWASPIGDFELDLTETVPYIGAAAVQNLGYTGDGIVVAVIDSGIDYTHVAFGGPGTVADYTAVRGASAADPLNKTRDGLFPTDKVIEGYDFVGELWNTVATLSPDPDPIDFQGHGTNVADIIAGANGVAPDAKLLAIKACSAQSTSCSGVAMLQAIDFALDPNGDDDLSDAADVINMSIGSPYGQQENALVLATANAIAFGTVVVASAGNSGDRPYITGSPGSTPGAISVAQTQVPSAKLYRIAVGDGVVGGSWQSWSAAPAMASAPLAYDTANSGTRLGCSTSAGANPFAPGAHAGKVLLMDRGSCSVSFKVANAAIAGAVAAIIANNAAQGAGDLPPDFTYGGGAATIPGYTITLIDGNLLKALLGQTASINPATVATLAGHVVATSARGPSYSDNAIKPDVAAPGASVSALVGSGTGTRVFGGTSGAAPMVAGSAALLLQARPDLSPAEVKALLMGTADTNIGINPISMPGVLAPITRIGGGEVRVNRAVAARTAAWDDDTSIGSLSFGYWTVTKKDKVERTVRVRNYAAVDRTYDIQPSFRFTSDLTGAVKIDAPKNIRVPANGSRTFKVKLDIDPDKLPLWSLNGGQRGGDGFRLQDVEFDGYLRLWDAQDSITVPWQVLPHRAADVDAAPKKLNVTKGEKDLKLKNKGAVDGRVEVFSLTGESPKLLDTTTTGSGKALIDLRYVGVRPVSIGGTPGVQFAIHTFGERAHPNYPAQFRVLIDTDNNGTIDRTIFNTEMSGFAVTGQNVTAVAIGTSTSGTPLTFTDADLNSANVILTVPLSSLGLSSSTTFSFTVQAYDNYFTGLRTDQIVGMRYRLDTPRYAVDAPQPVVPAGHGNDVSVSVSAVPGGGAASPSQTGLLLMYRDGKLGNEAEAVPVKP